MGNSSKVCCLLYTAIHCGSCTIGSGIANQGLSMSPSMNLETGSVILVTFLLASESGRHSIFWASCRSDCSNLQLLRILLPMPQRKCVVSILGNNVMKRIFSGIISPGSVLGGYFTGSLADYIRVKCIKFGFISL